MHPATYPITSLHVYLSFSNCVTVVVGIVEPNVTPQLVHISSAIAVRVVPVPLYFFSSNIILSYAVIVIV